MVTGQLGCEIEANYAKQGSKNVGQLRYILAVRSGQDISNTAGVVNFKTTLQAKLANNDKNLRAILIGPLTNPEFNGEQKAMETVGQDKYESAPGTWDYFFTLKGGGICDRKQLYSLQDKDWDFAFIYDDDSIRFLDSDTGIKGMAGLTFRVENEELATDGSITKAKIRVALKDIRDYQERCNWGAMGFAANTLKGVQAWKLVDVTPGGAADGAFDIKIVGTCPDCSASDNNMNHLYRATITASCFSFVTAGGATLTISSIAEVLSGTTVVAHRVQLSLVDTDYVDGVSAIGGLASISTVFGVIATYATANTLPFTLTEA
jgi:hypothetical protein